MNSKLLLALGALCIFVGIAQAADEGLMGYWPFDGALTDASGRGHDGVTAQPHFTAGTRGQALDPNWQPVTIANHPDLQLAPGLTLDCWVYFDQQPQECEQIVLKDKEYQLRVNPQGEGGRFALFVYLNEAWEPRLTGPLPEPGKWYHLVAKWTGTETVLEVNGEQMRTERRGLAVPTNSPVLVGNCRGRVDELRINNPTLAQIRALRRLAEASEATRATAAHYGGTAGWQGWQGSGGATVQVGAGAITATQPHATAALSSPPLAVDLTGRRYLSVDLEAPGARFANVIFITDEGEGNTIAPVWGNGRTAVVDLGPSPLWRGKLRLLAFSLQAPTPGAKLTLRNLWLSRQPEGRPYLYIRSLAPDCALPRAGRTEKINATVRSLGKALVNIKATLVVPAGVRVIGPATQTLPALGNDATEVLSWTVKADRPLQADLTVALASAELSPVKRRLTVNFTPSLNLPQAAYVPAPDRKSVV